MNKVKALKGFESVIDTSVNRTRKKGEVFEVSDDRLKVLLEHNGVKEDLIELVKQDKNIEVATLEKKNVDAVKHKEVEAPTKKLNNKKK